MSTIEQQDNQNNILQELDNPIRTNEIQSQVQHVKEIASYQIDAKFEKNIKQAKVQQDFLKNIDVYDNGKYFYGLTEQMFLKIFNFNESQSQIEEIISKKFPQPLYDSIMLKNKSDQDLVVVSIKNQPISIYKLQNNTQNAEEESLIPKNSLKNVGYLSSQKKNTEIYQTPLQFKYDDNKKQLFGVGKQFIINYDLNKFQIKDSYEKFVKSDILSCFDIPKQNSADYSKYQDIVAFGKFDKKIEILDYKQKKIINQFGLHLGGITCLKFDPLDSNYLYSGARKDDLIYQWDLRKQDTFVHYYQRKCTTNQRIQFDILDNTLAYGHMNGDISFVNINTKETLVNQKIHEDCVNTVKLFQKEDKKYCISTSGQRHYKINDESDTTDSDEDSSDDEIDMEIEQSQQQSTVQKVNKNISKQQKEKVVKQDDSLKLCLVQI
ncbi:WD domain, G-beta repeat protein (macronuclear) [Tetrahymena thermophila SB210]|uniref:WD domain, G-beta repeat protein n=1 Tax=Tetrahymena thermophila (strain SB210) TaxID=312017 RepID=I7M133_TETTS|nr:WD domain, G-beta repeat protein [Tetrahymena thermophila SB210]EAR94155.3 WD domain, G-beta repeat protein [Tetrahymena thermophila SB210]|eukprot:XP_001014400.3 WD domain, G-beta repeat protein [Tetrahymena thermophila SB210]